MIAATLERLLRRAIDADGGRDLERARADFHRRTGEFADGDPQYEARIQFFFDDYLSAYRSADGSAPALRVAVGPERELAERCLAAHRGLYQVLDSASPAPLLLDRVGGARFSVRDAAHLRAGDIFDGRVVSFQGSVALMPGIIFHPSSTHHALDALLTEVAPGLERRALLDGLLRMRMRLDRFTSIRAEHIYRASAIEDSEIMSAGWARRADAK